MNVTGTYRSYPELELLPRLIRRQRRLEAQIAPLEALQAQEKAVRDTIDRLLVRAGIEKGQGVTCAGYDVTHHERAGQARISADKLLAIGVSPVDVRWATTTGQPSSYATVRPMKGAKVRAA